MCVNQSCIYVFAPQDFQYVCPSGVPLPLWCWWLWAELVSMRFCYLDRSQRFSLSHIPFSLFLLLYTATSLFITALHSFTCSHLSFTSIIWFWSLCCRLEFRKDFSSNREFLTFFLSFTTKAPSLTVPLYQHQKCFSPHLALYLVFLLILIKPLILFFVVNFIVILFIVIYYFIVNILNIYSHY